MWVVWKMCFGAKIFKLHGLPVDLATDLKNFGEELVFGREKGWREAENRVLRERK